MADLNSIRNALNEVIQDALDKGIGDDGIVTAGWIPGATWEDTPYQPIYEKAAKRNFTLAALMFGLMTWEAFERHSDKWYTGKFEKDGEEIGRRTYFKVQY